MATCVGMGGIDADYASAHEEMRVFNVTNGFVNIEYKRFPCVLVEAGRDAVAAHALAQGYDYVLQVDADAAPFRPESLVALLQRAYIDFPDADAVGAYCQLKQPPFLPTIDTGTGTWEVHYPGEGVLPAIRTGGHFLLQKTSAFLRIGAEGPWHRTRNAPAMLDVMCELDSIARTNLGGRNPFAALPEWDTLFAKAQAGGRANGGTVGEDSAFCDALLAHGGKLYVDCDLVVGHVTRTSITPMMLKQQIDASDRALELYLGVRR